jgi:hypothetical protein
MDQLRVSRVILTYDQDTLRTRGNSLAVSQNH